MRLEAIPRKEYKILQTVEGRGQVNSFLCFTYGDTQFGYTGPGSDSAIGLGQIALNKDAVAAATYNALSKVPEADLILPLSTTTSLSGIPCFRSEQAVVRGKAIQIQTDK